MELAMEENFAALSFTGRLARNAGWREAKTWLASESMESNEAQLQLQ